MFLKRLKLQGYKTFAAPTEFDFKAGITAIVGPNGSGKSNITDAIRWVLGEQRPTSLRIKRAHDMIFAGSQQRARQGMAEVSIILDNHNHWLPLDYDEVQITRRVYRSGESEFTLNNSRMLVRDVTELLAKAGLSRDAYAVIGQGLVDTALSLHPTERRTLFEVAAGIDVYQEQKEEALERLEETQSNLIRVEDILHEIEPRLARLETQSQRAREHEVLSQDLDNLLRVWYGYHWQQGTERLHEIDRQQAEVTEFLSHRRAEREHLDLALADLGQQQAALRQALSRWHQESSRLHSQIEEKSRELAVGQERARGLRLRLEELETEMEQLAPQVEAQHAQQEEAAARVEALADAKAAQVSTLEEAQSAWAEQQQLGDHLERQMARVDQAHATQVTEMATHRNRLEGLAERRTALQEEQAELQGIVQDRQEALAALEAELAAIQAQRESLLAEKSELTRQRDQLVAKAEAQHQRVQALERQCRQAAEEISSLRSRRKMLQRMRREMSGYYAGVRAVVQAADHGDLSGILGPVVRLFRIDPELDTAIEVALGSHMQDVVAETWEDAEAAIELLKRRRRGRATFLPLDTIRARRDPRVPTHAGILGLASDLIEYDPRFGKAFAMLLNRTLIVEDLDTARRLLQRPNMRLRLVTLEGELVMASGSVSGGSKRETDSKLALERAWQELPGQLRQAQAREEERQATLAQAQSAQAEIEGSIQTLNRNADGIDERIREHDQKANGLERRAERLRGELALHSQRLERLESEEAGLAQRRGQLEEAIEKASSRRDELAADREALARRLQDVEDQDLQQAVSSAKAELAVVTERHDTAVQMLNQQTATLERLDGQRDALADRLAQAGQDRDALTIELEALSQVLRERRNRLEALLAQIEPAEAQVEALDQKEKRLRHRQEQSREQLHELEAQHQGILLERRLAREKLEQLQERIGDDLGPISLPEGYSHQLRLAFAQGEETLNPVPALPPNLETEIKELRGRIHRLGTINPNAPEEYAEERERYDFLQAQSADLQEAAGTLRGVVDELDELMETRFTDTFAEIAHAFSDLFSRLFGGGTARLQLSDPDDLSATGVDIIARPPGKRLQNLALLSGGERALTAVALLFALLKANPLPFCVLDEVDAMLDEANVGRFRDLLVEMSEQTQFIIITHNRHTVNAADTVYGISMQQDGVSAVLSLKLDEAEALIEEVA